MPGDKVALNCHFHPVYASPGKTGLNSTVSESLLFLFKICKYYEGLYQSKVEGSEVKHVRPYYKQRL